MLPGEQFRQKPFLLLLARVAAKLRDAEVGVGAVGQSDGPGGPRELLHGDDVLEVAQAEAAVLGRDGDSCFFFVGKKQGFFLGARFFFFLPRRPRKEREKKLLPLSLSPPPPSPPHTPCRPNSPILVQRSIGAVFFLSISSARGAISREAKSLSIARKSSRSLCCDDEDSASR